MQGNFIFKTYFDHICLLNFVFTFGSHGCEGLLHIGQLDGQYFLWIPLDYPEPFLLIFSLEDLSKLVLCF